MAHITPPDRPPTRSEIDYACALERPRPRKWHGIKLLMVSTCIAVCAAVVWVVGA